MRGGPAQDVQLHREGGIAAASGKVDGRLVPLPDGRQTARGGQAVELH